MIVNAISLVAHVIQTTSGILKHASLNVKILEDYSQNTWTRICENSKNLKSVGDNSEAGCDEIIILMDIISPKKTNIIATKNTYITSTTLTNYSKKVRDCSICHTVLLVMILVLIIFICYYYVKQKGTV